MARAKRKPVVEAEWSEPVKIGTYPYRLIGLSGADFETTYPDAAAMSAEGLSVMGICNTSLLRILVRTDIGGEPVPEARLTDTIWHESLHGLWDFMGLDPAVEEAMVQVLATGTMMVLRDNPWLCRRIAGEAEESKGE